MIGGLSDDSRADALAATNSLHWGSTCWPHLTYLRHHPLSADLTVDISHCYFHEYYWTTMDFDDEEVPSLIDINNAALEARSVDDPTAPTTRHFSV